MVTMATRDKLITLNNTVMFYINQYKNNINIFEFLRNFVLII